MHFTSYKADPCAHEVLALLQGKHATLSGDSGVRTGKSSRNDNKITARTTDNYINTLHEMYSLSLKRKAERKKKTYEITTVLSLSDERTEASICKGSVEDA